MEDRLLIWKLKLGSSDALRSIYEKYKNDLFSLALALSSDIAVAEDVLHDVFVSFAKFAEKLQLRSSLKSYLLSCVANRVYNLNKAKFQQNVRLDNEEMAISNSNSPDQLVISEAELKRINNAISQLPHLQKEVIILHLHSGMKFKSIAKLRGISINTIQSRYRYGLDKLRSLLSKEVNNE